VHSFCSLLYTLIIGFRTNSLIVETRVKSTLYAPILYWSGARHWAKGQVANQQRLVAIEHQREKVQELERRVLQRKLEDAARQAEVERETFGISDLFRSTHDYWYS
jgi:hypothetical protein